jgi:hypothetical protein
VDRQNVRFVPIKTDDQLHLQALHRVRERLMTRRTSVINQIRAFLLERGIVFAKSPIRLREAIPDVLENANENLGDLTYGADDFDLPIEDEVTQKARATISLDFERTFNYARELGFAPEYRHVSLG